MFERKRRRAQTRAGSRPRLKLGVAPEKVQQGDRTPNVHKGRTCRHHSTIRLTRNGRQCSDTQSRRPTSKWCPFSTARARRSADRALASLHQIGQFGALRWQSPCREGVAARGAAERPIRSAQNMARSSFVPVAATWTKTAVVVEQKRPDVCPSVRTGLRGSHVPTPGRPDPPGPRSRRERASPRAHGASVHGRLAPSRPVTAEFSSRPYPTLGPEPRTGTTPEPSPARETPSDRTPAALRTT